MTTVLKLSGVFFLSSWTRTLMGSGLMAGPTGIEPATYGLRVRRSNLTELRARLSFGKEPRLRRDIELSVTLSLLLFFLR